MCCRNHGESRSWPCTPGELLKSPAATTGRPFAAATQAVIAAHATLL